MCVGKKCLRRQVCSPLCQRQSVESKVAPIKELLDRQRRPLMLRSALRKPVIRVGNSECSSGNGSLAAADRGGSSIANTRQRWFGGRGKAWIKGDAAQNQKSARPQSGVAWWCSYKIKFCCDERLNCPISPKSLFSVQHHVLVKMLICFKQPLQFSFSFFFFIRRLTDILDQY